MRFNGLLGLAGLIAGAMVVGIAAILLGGWQWSNAAMASIALLAIFVASIFFLPGRLASRQGGTNAKQVASLGPMAAINGLALLLAAAAFACSLHAMDQLAWSADVLAVGAFLICMLLLRAATNKIEEVGAQYSQPSRHLTWQASLQQLAAAAGDKAAKSALEQLAEKLRYAPSDVPGGSPQDASLDQAIADLGAGLAGQGANAELFKKIDVLIAQREVFVRAARSRA